jgi:hypothetical protein
MINQSVAATPVRSQPLPNGAMQSWAVIGTILQFIGGVIMVSAWPGEEVEGGFGLASDTVIATGSPFGTFCGLLLASLGFYMLLAAVIAKGVKMGREASAYIGA